LKNNFFFKKKHNFFPLKKNSEKKETFLSKFSINFFSISIYKKQKNLKNLKFITFQQPDGFQFNNH